jgi:hypothetical protein
MSDLYRSACKLSKELATELEKRRLGWYILFGGRTDKKIERITKSLNMAVEKFEVWKGFINDSLLHVSCFR